MKAPGTLSRTRQRWLFWAALALITAFAVFVLPFQFPPKVPSYSSAYAVGFNNRVAALAVILLGLATMFVCTRRDLIAARTSSPPTEAPMPFRWLLYACLAMLLFIGVQGGLALASDSFESDAAYFLTQLLQWSHFHGHLYRDVEFGYGPLLFAWPAAFQFLLARAHISAEAAYLVSLTVMQLTGLATAFYLLQHLPLRSSVKGWLLIALTIGAMRPSLGLNYTLFRFIAPLAALVFIATRQGIFLRALLSAAAELLMLSISPEIGVAFFAGITGYALCNPWRSNLRWLSLPASSFLAGLAFVYGIGPGYLSTMQRFATGMLNQVVAPTPEILFFLLCAVALAPIAAATAIRQRVPNAGMFVGLFVAALALTPAALGLCDGLHTFFNGIGLYLLAFVAVSQGKPLWSRLCVIAFVLIAMPTQVQSIAAAIAARHAQHAKLAEEDLQATQWEQQTHNQPIFAPAVLSFHLRKRLLLDGDLQPDYFSGLDNASDPSADQIKVRELRQARFVLAPDGNLSPPTPDDRRRLRLLRFGYRYPIRFHAYLPLQQLRADLLAHAVPVASPGADGLILYETK